MNYSQKIQELLIKIGADLRGVTNDTLLLQEGIIDSLLVAQLTMEMEDAFQCIFEIDEIVPENFESINTISNMIRNKLEKRQGGN